MGVVIPLASRMHSAGIISGLNVNAIRPVRAEAVKSLRKHSSVPGIKNAPSEIIALGGNPGSKAEYQKNPEAYLGVEVTMALLFSNRDKISVLQLASNYGPYLHYLRYIQGMEKVWGIDLAALPVIYGKSIGSPVEWGDARQMKVLSSSMDLIITQDFLDARDFKYPIRLMRDDIHRVLKPAGWHISFREAKTWTNTEQNRDFFIRHEFSEEAKQEFPELKPVTVFQKA